jgi:outer membrane receptor protein involved in Fe transport
MKTITCALTVLSLSIPGAAWATDDAVPAEPSEARISEPAPPEGAPSGSGEGGTATTVPSAPSAPAAEAPVSPPTLVVPPATVAAPPMEAPAPATKPPTSRELPAIVVTDSKIEQLQDNVTQSVRVLYGEEIADRPQNQRNLSELLRYEPGVFILPLSRNDANWGSYGGLGPKYNVHLLDGLPVDSFVDDMSLESWAFERVESHRGPASVMYSNYLNSDFAGNESPLAGVTNFVLREKADTAATRLRLGYGSYNTLDGRMYHQDHAGNLHYFFGASYERSDYTGYGAPPSWLDTIRDPEYLKTKLYAKLTYFLGRDDHKVSLFAQHTSHSGDLGRPNRDFLNFYDTVNATYANQFNAWLGAQLKAGLRSYDRKWGEDNYNSSNPVPADNQFALREHDGVRQWILPADLTFSLRHFDRSVLTFGADGQYATYKTYAQPQSYTVLDALGNPIASPQEVTQNQAAAWSTGVFVQEKVAIDKFILRAGGRFNYVGNSYDLISGAAPGLDDQSWNKLLWSAGARYNALAQLAFYANAGSSFSPPAAKSVAGTLLASDVGVSGRNGQLPNPDLKPESGFSVDLGADTRPLAMLRVGVRGFFTQVSDAIVDNNASVDASTSQSQSVNAGKTRSTGVEVAAEQYLAETLSSFANFTYTHSRISNDLDPDQDGASVSFVPNWVANVGLTATLPYQVTVSPYLNAVGRFYDSTSKSGRKGFGDFAVLSLRLQKTFVARACQVDLSVALNNLTNKKYDQPWNFRDPGFNGMGYVQVRM